MRESPLEQLIFDKLFGGLALVSMLDGDDILRVAQGLERTETSDKAEAQMFADVARALRAYDARSHEEPARADGGPLLALPYG